MDPSATCERCEVLASYDVLDTLPEDEFDRLTRLAADVLDVPIAAINLLDDTRQWSKSWVGADLTAPLDHSFCQRVVAQDEMIVIEDALELPELAATPFVTGAPGIRFYAGAPIYAAEDVAVGTLCVVDMQPRSLDARHRSRLEDLAAVAADALELRRKSREHRATEAKLQQIQKRYRSLFEQASDAIFLIRPGGTFVEVNAQACRLTGYGREELLAMTPEDLITERSWQNLPLRWNRDDLDPKQTDLIEREIRRKDGTVRVVELNVRTVDNELVHGIARDITERKERAAKIQSLKSFYQDALNQLPIEVAIIDPEGRYEFVNPAAVSDPEVRQWLIGRTAVDYAHYRDLDPTVFEERLAWIHEVAETGTKKRFKDTLTTHDGETCHILRVATPVLDDEGRTKRIFAYGIDLTEQIKIQQALRESEQRWHRLVEKHPEPIMVSIEGEVVYANQASAKVYGVDLPDELIGRSIFDFVDAEYNDIMSERKKQLEDGVPTQPFEHTITRLDGERRTVESLSAPITYEGQPAAQTVIRDVTDRKRAEEALRQAKEKAEEMNRLKSAFLANMSHEIRTPLTSILGFADVLGDMVEGEAEELITLIQRSGDRLQDTLTSVLDLAQLESESMTISPTKINVTSEVRDTLAMFTRQADEKGIALQCEVPEDPVSIEGDERALGRVLINLISNAIKFTEEGAVTVCVGPCPERVTISVSDTGVGIDQAFLNQIFDAFKQESTGLARDFEGTGLGLTITKRLVDLMGGTITVESEKGVGTTFTVRLPREANQPNTTLD